MIQNIILTISKNIKKLEITKTLLLENDIFA